MIGRADIEGSKSDVAMNAWPPQASYPCGNFSDTYCLKPKKGTDIHSDGMTEAEEVDIMIPVLDKDDNSPVFTVPVKELSSQGTVVAKVTTDADEPGNPNSLIKYSILSEDPPEGMFYVTAEGNIRVKKPSLDRERTDQYILTIKVQDLNGQPGGNTGTGTVTINVLDVNDNPPTFEKATYEVNLEEHSQGTEVLRVKTLDLDQRNTENWEAVYTVAGNQAELFSIHTDHKTNEGVLKLNKPMDYEHVRELRVDLIAENKVPVFDGLDPVARFTDTCSVIINVIKQVEGPHFDPEVKAIPTGEGGSDVNTAR
ncbi:desmoglein-2-like protein [Neosynchiropus ocellatus]